MATDDERTTRTILITVDSLRADHLGQYGYHRDTMPALDELTAAGTRFDNAFANAPYTRISVPSFLTSQHLGYADLKSAPTLGSALGDAGVTNAVIGTQTGIGLVDGEFGFRETIDLGRDEYHDRASEEPSAVDRGVQGLDRVATWVSNGLQAAGATGLYRTLQRPYVALFGGSNFEYLGYTSAELVTDRVVEWLDDHREESFFLWVHYMEAHRPYGVHDEDPVFLDRPVPEEEVKALMKKAGTKPDAVTEAERRRMIDLYDSDVRYCSRQVSRLFDRLRKAGLWKGTNILFSSDHGEEFGEHGSFFHRNYPYDELIHVPLVAKLAGEETPDSVAGCRELLDLGPTVCSLHGVDPARYPFEGTPLFEGEERRVFSLGQPPRTPPAVAVRTGEWKYIHSDRVRRLYDLTTDPEERDDVAEERPGVADRLERSIPRRLVDRDVNAPRKPDDDADRQRLEALGYMEVRDKE